MEQVVVQVGIMRVVRAFQYVLQPVNAGDTTTTSMHSSVRTCQHNKLGVLLAIPSTRSNEGVICCQSAAHLATVGVVFVGRPSGCLLLLL